MIRIATTLGILYACPETLNLGIGYYVYDLAIGFGVWVLAYAPNPNCRINTHIQWLAEI